MLSTVFELSETVHNPDFLYIRILVITVMAILSVIFIYKTIQGQ